MTGIIRRELEVLIKSVWKQFPCVAILGPRQCGKSTLARQLFPADNAIYLDLELPSDLAKLEDAETFLRINAQRTICIDEIQRRENLFPVLRALIDQDRRPGRFLLLGSASASLLKQSSESLAGRIYYAELAPFSCTEVYTGQTLDDNTQKHLVRGGFPLSYLAENDNASFRWRQQFIKTYVEQDLANLGIRIPALTLQRFWTMCAHANGGIANLSKLGDSLGISHTTIKHYIDIFQAAFLLRALPSCEINLKKRLIKSPKLYLRDTGILNSLLSIQNFQDLLGHPNCGSIWETFCIENILLTLPDWLPSYYRTQSGNEIDLILERGNKRLAFEFKFSVAPKVTRGFWQALNDIDVEKAWIIAIVENEYQLEKNVLVSNLSNIVKQLKYEWG